MRMFIAAMALIGLLAPCLADTQKSPSKKGALPAHVAKSVRQVPDIAYAETENPRQALDLYLPANRASEKLPTIVYIHGGAWRQGDKRGGRRLLSPFVETGHYAGVSVGYRLSQEATWPAQIHDCKAAIRWIRANAVKYGLDPERIGVWGTSAGGHLVAMLGLCLPVDGEPHPLEGTLGKHLDQSSVVTCVVNYFGPSELLTMDDHPSSIVHNAPNSPESQLIGGALQEHPEQARKASPVTHVTDKAPPFLHMHGDKDRLVPYAQSVELDRLLDGAGVSSTLLTMVGRGHEPFRHAKLEQHLAAFFGRFLRNQVEKDWVGDHPLVTETTD